MPRMKSLRLALPVTDTDLATGEEGGKASI